VDVINSKNWNFCGCGQKMNFVAFDVLFQKKKRKKERKKERREKKVKSVEWNEY